MWETIKDIWYWIKEAISWRVAKKLILVFVVLCLLYYPIGMFLIHRVDADPDFGPDYSSQGSNAVAVSIALIDREVVDYGWVSNDPVFKPGAMLDNMAHYQQGIIAAIARFSFELSHHGHRSN